MARELTFYQKQRSRNQQPSTKEPCLICEASPTENCHIVDCLELTKAGIPPKLWNEVWNLIPLCENCHWLFDNRQNIWCGHKVKAGYDVKGYPDGGGYSKYALLNMEFEEERDKILAILAPRIKEVEARYLELAKLHGAHYRFKKGEKDTNGLEITSFDFGELQNGEIWVLVWRD